MHPRIAELLAYLDEQRTTLRGAFDAVPVTRRNQRPAPDEWSVGDVLTHVVVVDRRIAALFAKSIADARLRGIANDPNASPILPTLNAARFLDRETKIAGPKPLDPIVSGESLGWSDFELADESLKSAILQGDGLALNEISAPHPFFGPLDMYEWIAMVAGHRGRHAAQIRDVDAALAALEA